MRLRLSLALILAAAAISPSASAQHKPDAGKPDKADAAKPDKGDKPDKAGKPDKGDKPDPHQPPDPREEANRILARQADERMADLVKRGTEACERGEFDEGLAALASVWSRKNDPDVGSALAACEAKAKLWPAAADHYAAALRLKEDGPDRKKLEDAFAEVKKHVGALTIAVNVEGADVFVDDRFVGQTPLPGEVFVEPGKRAAVVVKKTGYEEAQASVTVAAQRTASLKIDLSITPSGGNRYASPNRSRVPFYVLGGAGLVAVGVGAALYAAAFTKAAAADDLLAEIKTAHPSQGDAPCQPSNAGCATIADLRKGRDKFMNIGTGALIGGGVLIGAAALVGVWTFSTSPSATGSIKLAPVIAPRTAGLWMTGAF